MRIQWEIIVQERPCDAAHLRIPPWGSLLSESGRCTGLRIPDPPKFNPGD